MQKYWLNISRLVAAIFCANYLCIITLLGSKELLVLRQPWPTAIKHYRHAPNVIPCEANEETFPDLLANWKVRGTVRSAHVRILGVNVLITCPSICAIGSANLLPRLTVRKRNSTTALKGPLNTTRTGDAIIQRRKTLPRRTSCPRFADCIDYFAFEIRPVPANRISVNLFWIIVALQWRIGYSRIINVSIV